MVLQAIHDIVSGKIPVNEEDAVKLAAYKLQCFWGDHDPQKDFVKQIRSVLYSIEFRELMHHLAMN